MSENMETRCWDCPNRHGVSRVFGRLAFKFWDGSYATRRKIKEQRGDCIGAIPVRLVSQGSGSITIEDDTVTHKTVWHDTYMLACPKDLETMPESPDEVKTAMRLNQLDVFINERVEINTQPLEEYEHRQAELRERLAAVMAQRTSDSSP
jgi:hypothetical protein